MLAGIVTVITMAALPQQAQDTAARKDTAPPSPTATPTIEQIRYLEGLKTATRGVAQIRDGLNRVARTQRAVRREVVDWRPLSALAPWRLLRNGLLFTLQPQYPEPRVYIRHKDVAVPNNGPPRKRRSAMSQRVDRQYPAHLPPLPQQITLQLARDIDRARAPLILAQIQRIAHDPDIVH